MEEIKINSNIEELIKLNQELIKKEDSKSGGDNRNRNSKRKSETVRDKKKILKKNETVIEKYKTTTRKESDISKMVANYFGSDKICYTSIIKGDNVKMVGRSKYNQANSLYSRGMLVVISSIVGIVYDNFNLITILPEDNENISIDDLFTFEDIVDLFAKKDQNESKLKSFGKHEEIMCEIRKRMLDKEAKSKKKLKIKIVQMLYLNKLTKNVMGRKAVTGLTNHCVFDYGAFVTNGSFVTTIFSLDCFKYIKNEFEMSLKFVRICKFIEKQLYPAKNKSIFGGMTGIKFDLNTFTYNPLFYNQSLFECYLKIFNTGMDENMISIDLCEHLKSTEKESKKVHILNKIIKNLTLIPDYFDDNLTDKTNNIKDGKTIKPKGIQLTSNVNNINLITSNEKEELLMIESTEESVSVLRESNISNSNSNSNSTEDIASNKNDNIENIVVCNETKESNISNLLKENLQNFSKKKIVLMKKMLTQYDNLKEKAKKEIKEILGDNSDDGNLIIMDDHYDLSISDIVKINDKSNIIFKIKKKIEEYEKNKNDLMKATENDYTQLREKLESKIKIVLI